jgi:hypothetical protein
MKYLYLALLGILLAGCNKKEARITGTAHGLNGETVNITDLEGTVIDSAVISDNEYRIPLSELKVPGYFTFSVQQGGHPRDFEIYLENVKYVIDIPVKTTDYLRIKTTSKTQNELSIYCNFEDSLMYKFRHEVDSLNVDIADPKNKKLSDAEFDNKVKQIQLAQAREQGARIGIISMFVDKYPQNEIVPHIITDMDYITNAAGYYAIYQKLSPAVKNSREGKKLGAELQQILGPGN